MLLGHMVVVANWIIMGWQRVQYIGWNQGIPTGSASPPLTEPNFHRALLKTDPASGVQMVKAVRVQI